MKKYFYFIPIVFITLFTFSCQKEYTCQCETINSLYNADSGHKGTQSIKSKNKETAKMECEGRSESWGSVVTTCTLQ